MQPLIFLSVAEMANYRGLEHDSLSTGAKYPREHGYGSEIFNFKPYKGRMYGYGQPPGRGGISLKKLGADDGAETINGITVIWVADSLIVGWYKNATVFHHGQQPPKKSGRFYKGHPIVYNVTAKRSDCTFIQREARPLGPVVPRAWEREHGMGRYIWYAEGDPNRGFRQKLRKYMADWKHSAVGKKGNTKKKLSSTGFPHQPDIYKKQLVENIAMDMAEQHFGSMGYHIDRVYKDNLGWDLEAVHLKTGLQLRLEAKGLSGSEVRVELTPQEYTMMRKHKKVYRVCVATNCLNEHLRTLSVFAYNHGKWTDESDRPLQIKEVQSARLYT